MTQRNESNRTRKGIVIALLAVLLIGAGIGVGAWVYNATPKADEIAQPATVPTPKPTPTPEPEAEPESIFVRADFCDENGVPNYGELGVFASLYDFTNPTPVTLPLDYGSNYTPRLMLLNGCDALTSAPEVVFTPIDVSGDHCKMTNPEIYEQCVGVHPEYAYPYPMQLSSESVFNEKNGLPLPEWLQGLQLWHIATAYGFLPNDGYYYKIPVSGGTYEMSITYEGKTYTTTVTVDMKDTKDLREEDAGITTD